MELSIRNSTQRCALLITVQKAAPLMLMAYMIVINLHTTYKVSIVKSITNMMIMGNSDVISNIFNVYTV